MSAEPSNSQFEALQSRFTELTRTDAAKSVLDAIAALERQVSELPNRITALRGRGYAFAAELETSAESLRDRWHQIATDLKAEAESIAVDLRQAVETTRNYLTKAESIVAKPQILEGLLPGITTQLEQVEAHVQALKTRVSAQFETLDDEAQELARECGRIDSYLSDLDEAAFTLETGEALFITANAEWSADERGKDKANGILYLTDQRLIFQQDEKVGKRLGLFGGKEVKEVAWIIPVSSITNARSENKGMLGGKDMVYVTGDGAEMTLEVKGVVGAKWWVEQIERARSGSLDRV